MKSIPGALANNVRFRAGDVLISEARAYAAQVVPEARGQAARVRTVAEGYKTASIARAQGDADRFSMLVDQYQAADPQSQLALARAFQARDRA